MTKDANIKREARARARRTGRSYAKVREELERDDLGFAEQILGRAPISIEQVLISGRGWAEPYVHRVRTKDGTVYLKRGATSKTGGVYALEAWAYRTCKAAGVKAPEVIAAAETGDDLDYIATREMPGASLWQQPSPIPADALRPILRQAGEQLRALHEIKVKGYGPITTPGVGSSDHWCPTIEIAITQNVPFLADRGALTAEEAADITKILEDAAASIPPDGPSRLLQGNLEGDHMFSDGRQFTGFIDFGDMQAGDPVFDLARLAWWDAHMLADVVDGYGRDALTEQDVDVRMPAYLLAYSTRIAGELRRNARPAQTAADWVRIARRTRFERTASAVSATAPAPKSPFEILVDAVRGKSDEQIDEFASTLGGYGRLLPMVFDGLRARNRPEEDCGVGFVVGEDLGWVLKATAGTIKITKRVPKRAPAIIRTSPQDLLRWVIGDLPHTTAIADGRMQLDGDPDEPRKMFAIWTG